MEERGKGKGEEVGASIHALLLAFKSPVERTAYLLAHRSISSSDVTFHSTSVVIEGFTSFHSPRGHTVRILSSPFSEKESPTWTIDRSIQDIKTDTTDNFGLLRSGKFE